MASKEDICRKIEETIPEAGKCEIDLDCLVKEKRIPLGLQVGQLKENLKMYHDCATSKVL